MSYYDYNALVSSFEKERQEALYNHNSSQQQQVEHQDTDTTTNTKQRQQKQYHLQLSLQYIEQLTSNNCPLTPLLWIKYGQTMRQYLLLLSQEETTSSKNQQEQKQQQKAAITAERDILELGLIEFPGSALLWIRLLTVCIDIEEGDDSQQILQIIQRAISNIGIGSHQTESQIFIAPLFRFYHEVADASSDDKTNNNDLLIQSFLERSKVPLVDENCTIIQELQQFLDNNNRFTTTTELTTITEQIEESRRYVAKKYDGFVTSEDDIQTEMVKENLDIMQNLPEFNKEQEEEDTGNEDAALRLRFRRHFRHLDWDTIILRPNTTSEEEQQQTSTRTYGMGLGGLDVARAFVRYAHAVQKKQRESKQQQKEDDDLDHRDSNDNDNNNSNNNDMQDLVFAIYERGISECPTVEFLWLSYIRTVQQCILFRHVHDDDHNEDNDSSDVQKKEKTMYGQRLQQITNRAVRNCPYSIQLWQQRISTHLPLAKLGLIILDPDQILQLVDQAMETKFLPTSSKFVLFLTAIRVLKHRIMDVLSDMVATASSSTATRRKKKKQQQQRPLLYDDAEPFDSASSNKKPSSANNTQALDDDTMQEIQDLVEDLSDMYDEVDTKLSQKQQKDAASSADNSQARALLWKDRAQTESLLLGPLRNTLMNNVNNNSATRSSSDDSQPRYDSMYEKCIRMHNPPHPDLYSMYIREFMAYATHRPPSASSPQQVLQRIRNVRYLFEKALNAVGNAKGKHDHGNDNSSTSSTLLLRDYGSALSNLCNEWLDFERLLGSERSLAKASKRVHKKISKIVVHNQQHVDGSEQTTNKRTSQEMVDERSTKKARTTSNTSTLPSPDALPEERTEQSTDPAATPATGKVAGETAADTSAVDSTQIETKIAPPKVRVGKLEYPAHPFTVRVSNLTKDTADMDLVDSFRPKCGNIVHARIMRDRHQHFQQSKGWGLIQFEDLSSVNKALDLDNAIGIHEKLVKVERSHIPAVSLVPPGMHRVNPMGEGRASKRNQKRREQSKDTKPEAAATDDDRKEAPGAGKKPVPATGSSVLAFRPRGVGRKSHQKQRIKLESDTSATRSGKKS